jgi:hypothetical protein
VRSGCPHKKRHILLIETHQAAISLEQIKIQLVAGEIVESQDRTKLDLLCPSIKIVPHAIRVAKLLATSRCMGLKIKVRRLFVQEKDVPMGCAHRRGSRADVIGDEGRIELERTIPGDLDVGLYPVEYGAQNAEGRERCVNVQAHD